MWGKGQLVGMGEGNRAPTDVGVWTDAVDPKRREEGAAHTPFQPVSADL